jgi:tetratricopeptide (TPR) repeat protein
LALVEFKKAISCSQGDPIFRLNLAECYV